MELWGNNTNINFPNIGIYLKNVPRGISIGNFEIAFYGIIIACAMVAGILIAEWQAKRTKQNPEIYLDLALIAIPLCVIGARIYSVAFEWDYYRQDLKQIFNLRNGGLAIYGGVITAVIVAVVFCKVRKVPAGMICDTGILGMVLGQLIGRWGNFVNREAFGCYTDSLFAMQIDVTDGGLHSVFKPGVYSQAALESMYAGKERALANILEIQNNVVTAADGARYIQVQPTFLYESLWNLALLIILIVYWKHKKFEGEIILWYLFGYGLGRVWIEGLRTDQLFLWNSGIAVSQMLSGVLVIASLGIIIARRVYVKKHPEKVFLVTPGLTAFASGTAEENEDISKAAAETLEKKDTSEITEDQ